MVKEKVSSKEMQRILSQKDFQMQPLPQCNGHTEGMKEGRYEGSRSVVEMLRI